MLTCLSSDSMIASFCLICARRYSRLLYSGTSMTFTKPSSSSLEEESTIGRAREHVGHTSSEPMSSNEKYEQVMRTRSQLKNWVVDPESRSDGAQVIPIDEGQRFQNAPKPASRELREAACRTRCKKKTTQRKMRVPGPGTRPRRDVVPNGQVQTGRISGAEV